MRARVVVLVWIAGCSTELGTRHPIDAASSLDAARGDASVDGASAHDAGSDTSSAVDAPVAHDTFAGETCVPPYDCTSCCGSPPDGCGGTLTCTACTDDIWCAPSVSHYQAVVNACVQSTMTNHPELFDPVMFRDTSSWLVIDDATYTMDVVACCNAMGLVCISDPNDDHEIRVRSPSDNRAENYGIRVHSTNRTWQRFMGGTCATTQF